VRIDFNFGLTKMDATASVTISLEDLVAVIRRAEAIEGQLKELSLQTLTNSSSLEASSHTDTENHVTAIASNVQQLLNTLCAWKTQGGSFNFLHGVYTCTVLIG
jgi:hypothetical protein